MFPRLSAVLASIFFLSLFSSTVRGQSTETHLVSVSDFDFTATGGMWWMSEFVGKGVTDLITDGLINDGSYRIVERKRLAAITEEQRLVRGGVDVADAEQPGKLLGAQYLIVGSITKFGTEKKAAGGILSLAGFARLKGKAVVAINARIVDVRTGEIITSVQGEGMSSRSGTLMGGLFPKVGLVAFSMLSYDYRDTILGEATYLSVKQVVEKLAAAKSRLTVQQQANQTGRSSWK